MLLFWVGLADIFCLLILALFWSNFVARLISEVTKIRSFEVTPKLIQVARKIIGASLSLEEIRDINRGVIDLISGMIVTRRYSLAINQIENKDTQISDKICELVPLLGLIYKLLSKSNLEANKNTQDEVNKTFENIFDKIEVQTQEGQKFILVRKENQELEEFEPTLENLVSHIDKLASRFFDFFSLERRIIKIIGNLDVINKPKLIKVSNLSAYQKQFEDASSFGQPISLIFNRISGEIKVLQVHSKKINYSRLDSALLIPQVSQASPEHIPLPIDLIFEGNFSDNQISVFRQAAFRWSNIIVGNLPTIIIDGQNIEGILIIIRALEIDGPHNRIARSGPTQLRPRSLLPATGIVEFDAFDIEFLEQNGSLLNVVTHELAHVFGFGTLWEQRGLLQGVRTNNPTFIGQNAMHEYGALIGANYSVPVPLESGGVSGTRYYHWQNEIFGNELMTAYLDAEFSPLGRITIASLEDIGYTCNYAGLDIYRMES